VCELSFLLKPRVVVFLRNWDSCGLLLNPKMVSLCPSVYVMLSMCLVLVQCIVSMVVRTVKQSLAHFSPILPRLRICCCEELKISRLFMTINYDHDVVHCCGCIVGARHYQGQHCCQEKTSERRLLLCAVISEIRCLCTMLLVGLEES
jgi:hypothetical protein